MLVKVSRHDSGRDTGCVSLLFIFGEVISEQKVIKLCREGWCVDAAGWEWLTWDGVLLLLGSLYGIHCCQVLEEAALCKLFFSQLCSYRFHTFFLMVSSGRLPEYNSIM